MPTRLESRNPTFENPRFDDANLKVLILRLSPYTDVDRSASHLFLAAEARRAEPASFVDFAFLPSRPERERLRKVGAPLLSGIESGRPFADFDMVLVSNSFALELLNLPYLLLQSDVPIWAPDRDEKHPPIILGGSNAFASQSVVRPDGTAIPDAIFFGEGEGHLERFLKAWSPRKVGTKRERLEAAANGVDGFWVTGRWPARPVHQAVARAFDPQPPAMYPILHGENAGTVRLQASYGCPAFCAFCFEGFERKPYREVPIEQLLARAAALKAISGAREVEVDAFNLNTHSETADLLIGLARLFDRVSFKSQRVDILADESNLAALEMTCGKRSFTLGIEGISDRMRAFLNKSLPRQAVEAVLHDLLTRKARELKLFYILTGHETAEDIAEFGAFCRHIASHARLAGTRIIFSFGLLVRMPNTPLRYDRLFLDRDQWTGLIGQVRGACESRGLEFRLSSSWPEYLGGQSLVAGGYGMAGVVAKLAGEGVCYDGQLAQGTAETLCRVLKEECCTAQSAVATGMREGNSAAPTRRNEAPVAPALCAGSVPAVPGEKPVATKFPFDFVEHVVSPDFLYRQFQRAKVMRDTGYCLGEKCMRCGACVNADEREAITGRPRVPSVRSEQIEELGRLMRDKARLPLLYLRARLPSPFGGVGPEWAGAALMRVLLKARPALTDVLLSAEDVLFGGPGLREKFPVMSGETVIGVRGWDAGVLKRELTGLRFDDEAWGELSLGEIEFSAPERFKSVAMEIRLDGEVDALADALCGWLQAEKFAFTRRRDGEAWALDVAPARQKAGLIAGRVEAQKRIARAVLKVGPRFNAIGLLESLRKESPTAVTVECHDLAL